SNRYSKLEDFERDKSRKYLPARPQVYARQERRYFTFQQSRHDLPSFVISTRESVQVFRRQTRRADHPNLPAAHRELDHRVSRHSEHTGAEVAHSTVIA